MVFDVLVGNSDDHLGNHGVLFDGSGWRLSPLYHVGPTPQSGTERFLVSALGVDGKRATLANALSGHGAFEPGCKAPAPAIGQCAVQSTAAGSARCKRAESVPQIGRDWSDALPQV